jgi:asparagine synthase (glutamine-hydrolysing)
MCRIAGIIDRSNPKLKQDITAMRDAMRRGGPDAEGIYLDEAAGLAFGHRRLSIIDLSEAGNQPMERDGVILSFNGEIYNYQELRTQLQASGKVFTTHSDTEVIIRAYQHWGTGCFGLFRGMFALAIYDHAKGEVVLARDHAGIKPLYYFCRNNKLYFASEIRAFNALPGYWSEREDWRIYFLTYGFLPEPVTTLKNVHPLAKASYKIFNVNDLSSRDGVYYQEDYTEDVKDLNEAKLLIKDKLTQSVKRHLISDAPIGLFLSGGIDSSILTILAKEYKPDDLHTLSLVFEDQQYSEKTFQDIIIERTQAHHQSFLVTKEDFENSIEDIYKAMDQPSTDGINSYFICKYARKAGLKTVLSGLGADEYFGGYPSFKRARHIKSLKALPAMFLDLSRFSAKDNYRKISFLQRKDPVSEYLFYRGYYTPSETGRLLGLSSERVKDALHEIKLPSAVSAFRDGDRVSYLESNFYMQSQLLKDTDAMSMWHSLEVRVPFLDLDLLNAVHRISHQLKFEQNQIKYLLIESFKDVLPREIWDRKKQGFVLPFSKWMKGKHEDNTKTFIPSNDKLHRRFNDGKLAWSRYWAYLLSHQFIASASHTDPADNSCQVASDNNRGRGVFSSDDKPKVLFLSLTTFSHAGGIEKFNRCFLKALRELEREGQLSSFASSPYDDQADERYYDRNKFLGLRGNRVLFARMAIHMAGRHNHIIVGHLNLAPIALAIKLLYPRKKLTLVAHGIEVWAPLKGIKKALLSKVDKILSVSNFTKDKLVSLQGVPPEKIDVFPNTIDPYFPVPEGFSRNSSLKKEHNIGEADPVLFTLSRLSSREKYKGYDIVLECLPELRERFPSIKYVIAGKYDDAEKDRLEKLIKTLSLEKNVIITGFVDEKMLVNYYQMSDLFIMPSRKEGFGIVFLEALVCGLPVMGGNKDGSVDALRNGELGLLVDPLNKNEIIKGIADILEKKDQITEEYRRTMQQKTIAYFGFTKYKSRLQKILNNIPVLN